MTPEQEQKLNEVYDFIQSLKANATIPIEVDAAFRTRLAPTLDLVTSAKTAGSENQLVNEAGSAAYSVLKPPDGFDEREDGGTTKYYPYYT